MSAQSARPAPERARREPVKRSWFNQISVLNTACYWSDGAKTTKTYLTTLRPECRFHGSMTAAPTSNTLPAASSSAARVSEVVVGLVISVVSVLGLIRLGAVAG